jgi:hypothetical protein
MDPRNASAIIVVLVLGQLTLGGFVSVGVLARRLWKGAVPKMVASFLEFVSPLSVSAPLQ